MEKFVAVVFDTEEAAYKGETALRDLHGNGELAVYAAAVIGKDFDGKVDIKKFDDEGPIGTAFGLILGGIVGVLAGPVASGAALAGSAAAGMAAGSVTGGMFGMYRDLWVAGIDSTMLDHVSLELLPGKSCLVASVDEVWTSPLDVQMESAGGTVFRKPRVEAIDEQYEADSAEFDREIAELKEEMNQTSEANKKAFHDKIEALKQKFSETQDKVKQRIEELDRQTKARLAAIDEQIKTTAGKTKEKFEKRKAEIEIDYKERKAKLDASLAMAKSALT